MARSPCSPAVQHLLDRAKIHDVQMRYARAIDQRDWDLLRTVFAKDGVFRYGGKEMDREETVKYVSGVAKNHTTYHFMGNQFINITGDEATSKTLSMLTHHATVRGKLTFQYDVVRARYIDKLRRQGDDWVIYDRGGVPDWSHTGLTKTTSDDPAVQLLLARGEMYDLGIRYGIAIDLRDWDHMRACFAPQMAARYGAGMEFTEIEKLVDWLIATRFHPFTLHMMGNQLVEFDGDTARMETYAKITHEHTDPLTGLEHRDAGGGGRYLDRLQKVNGHWRIGERGLGAASSPIRQPLVASSKDPDVQYLLDRIQIQDVITAYTLGLDRRDYDLVRACFAPTFTYRDGDKHFADADAFIAYIKAYVEQVKVTNHFLGNQLIDIRGNEAHVETYCYLTHRDSPNGVPSEWGKGGRKFMDKLVKRGERWLIAEREIGNNRMPEEKIDATPST